MACWLGAPLQCRDESRHGTQGVRAPRLSIVILARALRAIGTGCVAWERTRDNGPCVGSISEEFEQQLKQWRGQYAGNPRQEMIRLCLLALEREEIVSIAYREQRMVRRLQSMPIALELRSIVHHALLWAWKDEEMHAVYIRGMAICDEDKDLLPPWARFVRGIIDSPALQPTASREAVHQDESFEYVRRVLNGQLNRGLAGLAAGEPATWRRALAKSLVS